jgi:CDP-diacylglycerol--serine O-phosphatidyltransferase
VLLPFYLEKLGLPKAVLVTPVLALYAIAIGLLMVSRLRTFSGKLIGRRIGREFIAPVVALSVGLTAVLATYPYLTLALGCLLYLALIPVAVRQYRRQAEQDTGLPPAIGHGERRAEDAPRQLHS